MCHGVDHSQPGFGFLFRLYAAPRFFVDSALMTTTNTLSTLIRLLLWCGFADNMPACLSHLSTTERSAALVCMLGSCLRFEIVHLSCAFGV